MPLLAEHFPFTCVTLYDITLNSNILKKKRKKRRKKKKVKLKHHLRSKCRYLDLEDLKQNKSNRGKGRGRRRKIES